MEQDFDDVLSNEVTDDQEGRDEVSLRPQTLATYIGQARIKHELAVYIQAAKSRGEALDHVLLYGPPGLGKTTLAMVIANEMQVAIKTTSGPAIEKPGDLVALLNDLKPGDVLFIDEIHRLPKVVEEMLYSAMEDFYIDIVVGEGSREFDYKVGEHLPLDGCSGQKLDIILSEFQSPFRNAPRCFRAAER